MASHGRIIAIEGRSGVGKTTLVRLAARRFGWIPLEEAFDRLDRRPNLGFHSERELLRTERALLHEEQRRYREALRLRRNGRTVVADTGFLGPLTYTAGLAVLGQASASVLSTLLRVAAPGGRGVAWGLPDLIVYLDLPARARRQRAFGDPRRHPIGLDRRHEMVGSIEREFYRELASLCPARSVWFLRADPTPSVLVSRLGEFAASLRSGATYGRPTFAVVSRRLRAQVRALPRPRRERFVRHR